MQIDFLNIFLGFIEGFLLILSPCILPILPLILVGSIYGSKARPFGIIIGFIVMFTVVMLFGKWIIILTHASGNTLRIISYVLLILLGIVMMSNYLTEKVTSFTQHLNRSPSIARTGGFFSGLIFGGLIGLIWTPCVGPILAAVIVQTVTAATTFNSFLIVMAFATGVATPMLLIALLGKNILNKFDFFRRNATIIRKILGLVLILSVILMIFVPNLALINPAGNATSSIAQSSSIKPYPAPDFQGKEWINSKPLSLNELKGKVILIDFWTYSCINCIRSLPYVKQWYEKYHDKGLVVIGVHSPEFQFEGDLANVKNAVQRYGIKYPVVLDNDFRIWNSYKNKYWPSHYLINKEGKVIYQYFGEGNYTETERMIQKALGLSMPVTSSNESAFESITVSPEMYFGYQRAQQYSSPEDVAINQTAKYTYPEVLDLNQWALSGKWFIGLHNIISEEAGSSIKLNFNAKNVYAVMGPENKAVIVKVFLDGKPADNVGDVIKGQVTVNDHRLFTLISLPKQRQGTLELIASSPGLVMYTFTFGG